MPNGSNEDLAPTHRVLIVEANEHALHLLDFLFRRSGYEVQTAVDGRVAQSILQNSEPVDLIVLGLILPYVTGYQIITDAKQIPAWQHVPILVLSSRVLEQDIVRAFDLGANDYVTKPFRPQELLARAKRLVITHESPGRPK